ncbi:hypothetical protein [Metabacillus malikii]|uniref:DUF4306 domain-containing protein n=1 Tax=Metabacillus malikii TaxID=1504265 RepID=A0ABT9ZCU0_9BACI|nr:hypothetical protein [Metabacillus malikii]MDQ0230079.1 hypothetical protein [Metabacillus malikii]
MKILKRLTILLVGLAIIYGMSLADYNVSEQTDDNFKVIWKEYSTNDNNEFVIKEELNFFDGLINSFAILGKSIIDYPMDGWDFYNNSKDVITDFDLPFWANTILDILLFIFCFIGAAVVMIISIPILLYKLSFFEADPTYHLGISVAIFVLIFFTKYSEIIIYKRKPKPKPQSQPQQVKA